jgi:hypothetical protein
MDTTGIPQKKTLYKTYQVVWYILYVIEILIGFRIVMLLLGANRASPFVDLIYALSGVFVLPFRAIFPTPVEGRFVLDSAAIVALIVYPILTYLLIQLLQLFKPTSTEEAKSVDNPNLPTP